jgi:hypothetical protein
MLDELFLAALSRFPTAMEKEKALGELLAVPEADRRAALEDVFWCVLSSKEFVFNH